MRNYKVYFEIFGKKMVSNQLAKNENDAKMMVKDKIKFHKVELAKEPFNGAMDILDLINGNFKS
jgi:hypothetical protein